MMSNFKQIFVCLTQDRYSTSLPPGEFRFDDSRLAILVPEHGMILNLLQGPLATGRFGLGQGGQFGGTQGARGRTHSAWVD